jgi:cytochrome d ubiquinol oxidase subunit I
VSPLTTQQVGISLMAFVIVYFLVFGTGIYYMLKLMRSGPALPGQTPHDAPDTSSGTLAGTLAGRATRRPMSAADQLIDAA